MMVIEKNNNTSNCTTIAKGSNTERIKSMFTYFYKRKLVFCFILVFPLITKGDNVGNILSLI